jgi:uncharacterized protein
MKYLLPVLYVIIFLVVTSCNEKAKESSASDSTGILELTDKPSPLAISNPEKESVLRNAALEGNLNETQKIISESISVNSKDPDGRTALMLAAFNGHTQLVEFLLMKGASLNVSDFSGRTALMYASTGPNADVVKILLENGAEVNLVDLDEQFSALMFAAAEGQLEVVKLLLQYKADKKLKDKDGDTAESFARSNGHIEVADFINKWR